MVRTKIKPVIAAALFSPTAAKFINDGRSGSGGVRTTAIIFDDERLQQQTSLSSEKTRALPQTIKSNTLREQSDIDRKQQHSGESNDFYHSM